MGLLSRRTFAATAVAALSGLAAQGDDAAGADPAPAPAPAPARRHRTAGEFRGMWLATVAHRDWPSRGGLSRDQQRAELLDRLDMAVRLRLNTVMFQVRPAADALWPSPYEPWSEVLTGVQGQDPGWDPLDTAVREAHARGLELHAWFNPYRVANHTDPARLAPAHPARRHPDWIVPYGGRLYYNPGLPQVRAFVQDAMLDAVRRYPVDAVHWDDYFYPYAVDGEVFDDDAAFAEHGAGFPDRASWRRDNIDRLVREMAEALARTRPAACFGISPFGVWRNAATDPLGSATAAHIQTYDDLHADTRKWVREQWIDYICPQLYWNIGFADADYAELLPWWADVTRGTCVRLYVGEALYKAGAPGQPEAWRDPAELSRHLTLAGDCAEVRGHAFFSATEAGSDRIGAMARVVADHYQRSATPPRRARRA
ncbi:glycoside hydrolase family 10 protein [Streptomyces sp. Tue6028]|uniref:glycoside hydrolase family 10 protein n=1 Tax=Streptomyces sp. Tue6028 TaxID=2036037 RepID=UPI003D718BE5